MGLKINNRPVLTPQELLARWGWKNIRSLANMRSDGRGPKFEFVGRFIVYPVSEVTKYENANPSVRRR